MKRLTKDKIAKYTLADILPICGECKEYRRKHIYKDAYCEGCHYRRIEVKFVQKACYKFKPNI